MFTNIITLMSKKLCENTLFRVLFYRKHKVSFDNFSRRHVEMKFNKIADDNIFTWIQSQSRYIDEKGLANWIQHADGATGVPPHLPQRTYPFTYIINFRHNIFYSPSNGNVTDKKT
jgi:hypothetical protein